MTEQCFNEEFNNQMLKAGLVHTFEDFDRLNDDECSLERIGDLELHSSVLEEAGLAIDPDEFESFENINIIIVDGAKFSHLLKMTVSADERIVEEANRIICQFNEEFHFKMIYCNAIEIYERYGRLPSWMGIPSTKQKIIPEESIIDPIEFTEQYLLPNDTNYQLLDNFEPAKPPTVNDITAMHPIHIKSMEQVSLFVSEISEQAERLGIDDEELQSLEAIATTVNEGFGSEYAYLFDLGLMSPESLPAEEFRKLDFFQYGFDTTELNDILDYLKTKYSPNSKFIDFAQRRILFNLDRKIQQMESQSSHDVVQYELLRSSRQKCRDLPN